jgi:hypothetical protein
MGAAEAPAGDERDPAACIVAQLDGSMVPIVTVPPAAEGDPADGRKRRELSYNEARLAVARESTQERPFVAATMGSVDAIGDGLLEAAQRAGLGPGTIVHGVGDGIPWVRNQMLRIFADHEIRFTVDFYHLSEYLAEASKVCAPQAPDAWFSSQKLRMLNDQTGEVIAALKPYREPEDVLDVDAPVRAAHRYLSNRPGQFQYAEARAKKLPIGSGEVEGGHRSVYQKRIDVSGAWWTVENADAMLQLRAARHNSDWEDYWTRDTCQDMAA